MVSSLLVGIFFNWWLSHAARLELINSVFASIPVYYMSDIIFSKKILAKITAIIRTFWWTGVSSEPSSKPLCLKAWKDICAPKNEGGLGVRNLQAVNHGLILAAAWRIAERPNSQLYRVLQSKYFYDTSIWRPKSNLPKSAFWTAVLKILPLLQQNSFYQIMAGNTSNRSTPWCQAWTSVFDDLIIQQEPFSYPARVNQLWIQGQRIWDTTLIDSLFAPPTAHIIRNTPIISSDENDILVWKPSPNGKCSSKSAYRVCLQALQGQGFPAPAPVDTLTLKTLNQV